MGKYGEPLTKIDQYGMPMTREKWARIVACHNALAGVDHPEALPALLSAVHVAIAVVQAGGEADDAIEHISRAYRALFEGEAPRG